MPSKNPKNQFKKGNKFGKGRPPLTGEEKALRHLTKTEVTELASMILKGSNDELLGLKDNPNTTIFQTMIASVAIAIIKKGDMDALDKLLNRLIGKVKEEVDVNTRNLTPVILKFEDNGRQVRQK